MHAYNIRQFTLKRMVAAVVKAGKENIAKYNAPQIRKNLPTRGPKPSVEESELTWPMFFLEAFKNLQTKISLLNTINDIFQNSSAQSYKYILKNQFSRVETLAKLIPNSSDRNSLKKSMNECLVPIKHFLSFIATDKNCHCDLRNSIKVIVDCCATMTSSTGKMGDRTQTIEWCTESVRIQRSVNNILSDFESVIDQMFPNDPDQENEDLDSKFPNIEKLRMILNERYFLKAKEKKNIINSVPLILKCHNAIDKLKNAFEGKSPQLTKEEVHCEVSKLPLSEQSKKYISENYETDTANTLADINSIPDYFADLVEAIDKDEIDKKMFDLLCEKLQLPDDSRKNLSKIVKGQKQIVHENELKFLMTRISQLKCILIDENRDVKKQWESSATPGTKDYVKEKLVRIYLSDPEVQLSVEMLLFDCMNILKRNGLKHLWRKTSNLFNGICLRNVLSHGNPLLESLCRLLDPCDLSSELVREMLLLISDGDAIGHMLQLLEKTGGNFSGFISKMNDEKDAVFKDLRIKIKKCTRWEEYVRLIPLLPLNE